jgi:hypothetical protein
MNIEQFSLIPEGYRDKDPRSLLFLYPNSINIVAYAKSMQKFAFFQALEVAEDLAKRQGFILLPWSCIHWQRAKNYGIDRKIKIGRKSFFLMKPDELTKSEATKLKKYLEELHENDKVS